MKMTSTDAVVEDLFGLVEALKKRSFRVLNVAGDKRGTYVYLEDGEDQDPIPVVLEWVGKPAPRFDMKAMKARAEAMAGTRKTLVRRIMGFFSRKKAVAVTPEPVVREIQDNPPQEAPAEPPAPVDPKFYRKIL